MNNPTSASVKTLINTFRTILPMATRQEQLSMQCTRVNNDHVCGSVHCHAGWYAIAKGLHRGGIVNFMNGSQAMGEDLFNISGGIRIMAWAHVNPAIWGNTDGEYIFAHAMAFKSASRPNGAQTLADIIDHWQEVYERLVILENQVAISDPPITAEELVAELAEPIYETVSV